MVTAVTTLKDTRSLEEKHDKLRQYVKKQKHHFPSKGLYSQNYGFSSSHVQMCELDHKDGRVPEELMLSNCSAREDSSESLGQHGDQTSQS